VATIGQIYELAGVIGLTQKFADRYNKEKRGEGDGYSPRKNPDWRLGLISSFAWFKRLPFSFNGARVPQPPAEPHVEHREEKSGGGIGVKSPVGLRAAPEIAAAVET